MQTLRTYIRHVISELKKVKEKEKSIEEFSGCGAIVGAMVPPTPEQAKENNKKSKPLKIS